MASPPWPVDDDPVEPPGHNSKVELMFIPEDTHQIGLVIQNIVRNPEFSVLFAEATKEARAILASDANRLAGTVPIDRALFGSDLPEKLKSCRLSVMRGGSAYKIERHPNGTQFVYSLEQSGTISVFDGKSWHTSHLSSEREAPLTARWHVVPASTWHQPVPGEKDWVVLAFHTAAADELIDDYGFDGPV